MKSNRLLDPTSLKVQLVLTVLTIYLHTFSEWIFFITKPSFFSQSTTTTKLLIMLLAPLPLVLAGAALVLLWHLISLLIKDRTWRRRFASVGILIPAGILAATALLLIDNFTYTIFHRGVITAGGFARVIYMLLVVALVSVAIHYLGKKGSFPARNPAFRMLALLGAVLLVISLLAALLGKGTSYSVSMKGDSARSEGNTTPNILVLASDAMKASHFSLYGYSRDTTPIMRRLAGDGLICENCFTNAGCSGASITSMFTGRLPTRLKLIYPPDILRGVDAYRHLPGIMRQLGYRNFDISVRHHADPYDLNMRNAFDWANFREIEEGVLSETLSRHLGMETDYFLQRMSERISERLLHISGYRQMVDSYAEVVVESEMRSKKRGGRKESYRELSNKDYNQIEAFFSLVDESHKPFFAHVHLLGTHGSLYYPKRRIFSRNKEQSEKWIKDFYDDAILNFDLLVGRVLNGLEERKLLDNTLIVILTDHGPGGTVNERIPLLFLFPGGEHAGRIRANTQILDISPTILDYLGIAPPDWMEGASLLAGEPDSNRYIFSAERKYGDVRKKSATGRWMMDAKKLGPPFYSLGSVGVVSRDKFFKLVLEKSRLDMSDVEGHTLPAAQEEIPAPEEIEQLLVDHLAESGYDISTLKRPFTLKKVPLKKEAKRSPATTRGKKRTIPNREIKRFEAKK